MFKKYKEERPWGSFDRFCHNEKSTVKILTVKSGEELSLQYHLKRDEFWRVVGGRGLVIIDSVEHQAKKGDEFFIPRKAPHQIKAPDHSIEVMEISFGRFDEHDEVRLSDKYKR